jgi:hypothetical protein
MAKILTFKCEDVIFDVYDSERVPMGEHKYLYFITPKRFAKIEVWRITNNIESKISTKEQLDYLIVNDYIGTYTK